MVMRDCLLRCDFILFPLHSQFSQFGLVNPHSRTTTLRATMSIGAWDGGSFTPRAKPHSDVHAMTQSARHIFGPKLL